MVVACEWVGKGAALAGEAPFLMAAARYTHSVAVSQQQATEAGSRRQTVTPTGTSAANCG